MGPSDFGGNVETQAQPFLSSAAGGARKRLEKLVDDIWWDRLAEVCHGKFEGGVAAGGAHPNRSVRITVAESVREQVGEHLGDASGIAVDRPAESEFAADE